MILQGSKRAKIMCLECAEVSNPFRVTLYKEDTRDDVGEFTFKDMSEGWEMPDEAEMNGDTIGGYCPKHREVMEL